MRFTELASLSDASSYFKQDEKFTKIRIPNEKEYIFFKKYLEPEFGKHGDVDTMSYALSGYLFDADDAVVDCLLETLLKNGIARFEYKKRSTQIMSTEFHLPMAVASTCKSGIPPDSNMIKSGLTEVLVFFEKNKKKISHEAEIRHLVDSIYIAFLAHDLESVERLLNIRNNTKLYPFMDNLARQMLKNASYETIQGRKIVRISDAKVKEDFISLLNAHRDWTAQLFTQLYPHENCRLLADSFLASYCLAWIYLQSFATEPVFQISKADMRLILTDTTAQ